MGTSTNSNDDRVWLVHSSDVNRGEFISRMVLPEDAERSVLVFEPARVGMDDDGIFEVWIVDDAATGGLPSA